MTKQYKYDNTKVIITRSSLSKQPGAGPTQSPGKMDSSLLLSKEKTSSHQVLEDNKNTQKAEAERDLTDITESSKITKQDQDNRTEQSTKEQNSSSRFSFQGETIDSEKASQGNKTSQSNNEEEDVIFSTPNEPSLFTELEPPYAGIEHYLRFVDFPASKEDIVIAVEESGAANEIIQMVSHLEDKEYHNSEEVLTSLQPYYA